MGCGGSKGATAVVQSHSVIPAGEAPTSPRVKGQKGQSDMEYECIERSFPKEIKESDNEPQTLPNTDTNLDVRLSRDNDVSSSQNGENTIRKKPKEIKTFDNLLQNVTEENDNQEIKSTNNNDDLKRLEMNKRDEDVNNKSTNDSKDVKRIQTDPSPARVETRKFTKSPFDPSVEVGKEPIPVFGSDAFPLSKGQGGLKIEDTFWAGKRALIPDYSRMVALDKHAVEAPTSLRKDINKLVSYLTGVAKTDLEKFRVIFRWTAHNIEYDVEVLKTGIHGDSSKEGTLASGKAVCEGYSVLILGMCKIAGIQCEKLSGHAKGAGYEPGMKDMRKMAHAWNRVTLDGQTYFSDCTWAAGSVGNAKNSTNKDLVFSRAWKEQHFLAEPQGFTARHITRDLTNQDCPSPYASFDKWNNEPHLSLTATFAGLRCLSHKNGVITTPKNTVLLRFSLERVMFHSFCVLEDANGKRIVQAVVHWWNGNELSCQVTLPKAGRYTFMLIGKFSLIQNNKNETSNEVLYPCNAEDATENRLVSYTIIATANKGPKFESNSEHMNLFGAPPDLPQAGLVPATKNRGLIKAPNGVGCVVFKKVGSGPSKIHSKLDSFDDDNKPLDSSIYCEHFGGWVVCHVRCPSTGLFSLSLYVTGHDGRNCTVKYIIASEGAVTPYHFPVIHGMAGPRANFFEIGLSLAEAVSSTIETEDGEGVLNVKWDASRKIFLIADLKDASGSKSLHEEGHVIVESSPDSKDLQMVARIGTRVQNKGLYKLALFAKEPGSSDNAFVGSWLVVCHKSNTRELYPKQASVVGPREDFANLGLWTDVGSRVTCEGGVGVMEVRSEMHKMTRFLYNLTRTEKEKINGYVFADTTIKDGERITRFNFRMKQAGLFAFRLFANQNDSDVNTYVGVWLVECDVITKLPLFPGKHASYGPNKAFREGGLEVDESMSKRIELNDGEGKLAITHKLGTNRRLTVRLEAKGGIKYDRCDVSTMLDLVWTTKGEVSSTTVRIRLKDPGLYDLLIFVEKAFAGVWLIDCVKETTKPLFPEVQGSIGPSARFFEMGLTVEGHLTSALRATKDGMCSLSVKRCKPFETIFRGSKDDMNIKEEWRKEDEKHMVTCSVQLPRKGLYALRMFASEASTSSKDFMGNWLLDWEGET